MRGLALFAAFFSALPIALVFPFIGLLVWAWFAFMSPHRETFGITYDDFQFNLYIAVVTLTAWLFSNEPKRIPLSAFTIFLGAFAIWTSITTYFALDHEHAYALWDRHIRSVLLALMVAALASSKVRIQAMIWIICISLGYIAVKGAGFIFWTGGAYRVFGPPQSSISDNNNLSLALVITMPLMTYLIQTSRLWFVKAACGLVGLLSIVTVVGTYSRGGFLGLLAVGLAFFFMSRRKLAILTTALAFLVLLPQIMPAGWYDRMATIEGYEQDPSVVGRFAAWSVSWNLAQDRPLVGGGFSAVENDDVYIRYRTVGGETHGTAAHSIYFQVLGDHGFAGLFLYLAMLSTPLFYSLRVVRLTRDHPELRWATTLARTLQVSFIGFVVAGAALSMAYYDVFLTYAALAFSLDRLVRRALFPADAENEEGVFAPRAIGGLLPARAWQKRPGNAAIKAKMASDQSQK